MSASKPDRFLIGPATLDCNRGDQALMWEAIAMLRRVSPDCEIATMTDGYYDSEDVQSRQTRKLGIDFFASLLPPPRRAASQSKEEIIDSGWSAFRMKMRAILDFVQTGSLLALAFSDKAARLLLGKERYKTYKYLQGCDALVIKGGGYIYAYGGLRWAYYIWFGLFPLMLAQRCGVRVIILPNSLGPFDTKWGRWLAHRVLGRCKAVTVREPKSLEVSNSIIQGLAKYFPDMAFNLEPADSEWAKAELTRHAIPLKEKSCVGITMRPWRFPNARKPDEKYSHYVQAFAGLIEYLLQNGYVPVLYAHVVGPHSHENDRIALRDALQAVSETDKVFYVDGDYDCREVKSLYGHMNFMVCTRFHSAIFSIAQQVPCLAVSYQGYKATGIMREMGLEDYLFAIDEIDSGSLIEGFEKLVANRQEVKQKMSAYMNDCARRLDQLEHLIAAKIRE